MYIRSCVWWRHQMETFSALLVLCAGNSPVAGEFPAQRPVTRSFVAFFDLRLNKRLSKQSWGWWFETQSHPLWRHSNVSFISSGYREWNTRHIPKHTNIQSTVNEDYIIDTQLTTCKVLSHTVRNNDSQFRLYSNWQFMVRDCKSHHYPLTDDSLNSAHTSPFIYMWKKKPN